MSDLDVDLRINHKMTTNRIFDLKYGIYGQKKFSWIYINSRSVDAYNITKSRI